VTALPTGVAHARAGILGNPSDGYGGKAIACTVANFAARATIEPSRVFAVATSTGRIVFPDQDEVRNPDAPVPGTEIVRLAMAALRRFVHRIEPSVRVDSPFTLSCETDIPRQVGLGGSSAMIIAVLRALSAHFDVPITPFDLAEHALAVEMDDLGIVAGPMDRVIQSYGGVMEMDLASPRSTGSYRPMDPTLVPPLVIAWDPTGGVPSGVTHGDLRARWLARDPVVLETIDAFREVVEQGVLALEARDRSTFVNLVNLNFELRCRIVPVSSRDREMVMLAQQHGAAAKLCGSGGAVLILHPDDNRLQEVEEAFNSAGFSCVRPVIR
jgi:glucuronokinase